MIELSPTRPLGQRSLFLGLDIGTSSAKVCAVQLDGVCLGTEIERYPTSSPLPGWAEQNADDWLPALGRACRRLLDRLQVDGADVLGLAVTSAAHVGVLLDRESRVLRPAILWNDQRSKAEAAELSAHAGHAIFEESNNWPTTTWTLPHLVWIQRHDGESWARTRHILLSKDYVAFRLTGRMATDPAAAVSALLYDVTRETWSQKICTLANIPPSALPEVLPIGAQIGTLTAEGAACLGVSQQALVFNGTVDSTAETVAAGVHSPDQCVIRLASAGGIHAVSERASPHPKLISYPYPIAPFWLSQAGTGTCDAAVDWARRVVGGEKSEVDFEAWSALAEQSSPGANGVLFHPYLSGERCPYWDPDLRASFIGLGLNHGAADLARAVYEGAAYSLRDAFSVLQAQGFAPSRIKLVGGGARSALWCQTISNVFGFPVTPAPEADSSVGAALLALTGLTAADKPAPDVLSSRSADWQDPTIAPDMNAHQFHNEMFGIYRRAQTSLSSIYRQKWPSISD